MPYGTILAYLASAALGKLGADAKASREERQKRNNQLLDEIVTAAKDRAINYGENPYDTPETRKYIKSLGGDESLLDAFTLIAQQKLNAPEVQARRSIEADVQKPGPVAAEDYGAAGPLIAQFVPPTAPPTGQEINQRISQLSPEQQAFAFPQRAAATAAGTEIAAKQAGTQYLQGQAATEAQKPRLLEAQRTNLEEQTRLLPEELSVKQKDLEVRATAARNQHETARAELAIRLQGVQNDAERNQLLAEQTRLNAEHQREERGLAKERNEIGRQQVALSLAEKYATGASADEATQLTKEFDDILAGKRQQLSPALRKITPLNINGLKRVKELRDEVTKLSGSVPILDKLVLNLKSGELDPASAGTILMPHNEQIVGVIASSVIEAKNGIIPTDAFSDPRGAALATMKGITKDGRILPVQDIMRIEGHQNPASIPGVPLNFNDLLPTRSSGASASPGTASGSVSSQILRDNTGGGATSTSTSVSGRGSTSTTAPPDIPPSEYLQGFEQRQKTRDTERQSHREAEHTAATALVQQFDALNLTLPKARRLPKRHLVEYLKLAQSGMTPNQAFNRLLAQHGVR